MGRAPNPGAPQRVSAHVIAKAQPFSGEDDEKTTIESGWEDEASTTTVEQNEVAERIRALGVEAPTHKRGGTNVTSTNGSAMDEPTVDDQHAAALIAMLPPPPSEPARLLITQGNDSGAELQVMPGKTYTIGRAIDNDVVLTDIAVSRKHFDLTFEGSAWVLVDRGSGNGTLVNGNVEDQPFMLANGDTIEIGNTIFRFDNANGVTREAASYLDAEEEEPSTVAGKPMGRIAIETPVTLPPPAIISRPKTIPPPLPRPRTQSGPPAPLYPPPNGLAPNGLASSVMPSSTLPLPQMAGRAPVATPQAPTLLGHDSMQRPQVLLPPQPMPTPQHMQLQTTIPGGHNAPPSIPPIQGMPFGYPVLGMDRPSAPGHAQMLVIAAAHAQGRDAPTTAHVPPVPYSAVMAPQSHGYGAPQLSRKMKMVLGGAALALVAAVATVAIIKGASRSDVTEDIVVPASPTPPPSTGSKTTVVPIKDKIATTGTDEAAKAKAADDKRKADDAARIKKAADDAAAKKATDEQAKRDEDARIKKAADDKRVFEAQEAVRKRDEQTRRDEQARRDDEARTKKAADDKRIADQQEARRKAADEAARKADDRRKAAAEEAARKADDRKKAAEEAARRADEKRRTTVASSDTPRPSKGGSSDSVAHAKNEANAAYRAKNFQQAANILRSAVAGASNDDTTDLKSLARSYEQFGKAYNNGMSPGAKSNEAFPLLRTAVNFDAGIGGAYTGEIRQRLGEVAPAAAVFFYTHKSYKDALAAVQTAESLNASNSTTQTVRNKLESEANRLYNEANSEAQTNTPDAKEKLLRIKDMLEAKSSTYQKASKLLASLP
ncbi:MAG TPA: FHA domain-containing protein [Kofleriaceae bacterium]|nr:FHA domain-containing protein [Kofleriaceae bacterium]